MPRLNPAHRLLEQALSSLDAAEASVVTDPDAATDDILAARLLVATALLSLSASGVGGFVG